MKALLIATLVFLLIPVHSFAVSRVEGQISKLDVENMQYTIRENATGKMHVFDFKNSTSVRINKRKYRDMTKLNVGDSVIYKKSIKKKKKKYVSATIQQLDKDAKKVTFIESETGALKTYKYEPEKTNRSGKLDANNVQPGQRVVLEIVSK
ncbi:hypothetical protein [Agarilytica rhodophyticola]|uniref:hypothetical protein n=1 Tax=Agarilytica rhodophyticola TaxID=1737490 RepID=UPI000B3487AA|nr:hypothetical protein [Agarilytica rhodophyticola]